MVSVGPSIEPDDLYVLNHCTKFLARRNADSRHDFGQYDAGDPRARICEAWRFPIIDSYRGTDPGEDSYAYNKVTFVYRLPQGGGEARPPAVGVIGTFATLYDPLPLRRVRFGGEETDYYALALRVPKGRVFRYRFVVDGASMLDPINPQHIVTENGERWSRFFTHLCTQPLTLEAWESEILERLVDHIMPFETDDAQNFLFRFYDSLSTEDKERQYAFAYRLDRPIGIVNFIDNLLSREERHHVPDYKICLAMIGRIMRRRAPNVEPSEASKELYIDLYGEMAAGTVNGWDYDLYQSPQSFLQVLRRHAYTGAFSHPKYGGNAAALGWRYLADRYKDAGGATLFDWPRAIEPPLGTNTDYRG